jgi:flagellar biosynthesis/type III secretory pathway protein FliH
MLKLPVEEPIAGLRMHPSQPVPGTEAAATVQWLIGLGDARRRRDAEHKALLTIAQSVERTLLNLPGTVNHRLDAVAGMVVELGLAVAGEIVGAALEQGLVDPTPTVARCLREAVHGSDQGDLKIHLHPEDLGLVFDRLQQQPELHDRLAAAELVADAAVARGAVRAETGAGRLRWDPREVLQRISREIRAEVEA